MQQRRKTRDTAPETFTVSGKAVPHPEPFLDWLTVKFSSGRNTLAKEFWISCGI